MAHTCNEMRARPAGFELTFTPPVDAKTAGDVKSYALKTCTCIYQSSYGSPEVDHTTPTIERVTVGADGKSVRLTVSELQQGHIHELHAAGVPLLHRVAYYTLNYIPTR